MRNKRESGHGYGCALIVVAIICILIVGAGCFTRTVYVPAGQPVRLRQTVRSVKVWVIDKDGKPVPSVKDLQEGGYYSPTLKSD